MPQMAHDKIKMINIAIDDTIMIGELIKVSSPLNDMKLANGISNGQRPYELIL